ncbi:nucleoplasmin-2 [Hyperolius riggenbachi]|uniref:nucleoplasmin-2 n=1 Tax=Hyperolius riggenbachi TaxID=752182 RepID=UPI0035A2F7BF
MSSVLDTSKLNKPVATIWGCTLSDKKKAESFQVASEDEREHQLALRTICLGHEAKDEFHVIAIVPQKAGGDPKKDGSDKNGDAEAEPIPIATLKPSVMPMTSLANIELTPPVHFKLLSGSGPVYICGENIVDNDYNWEEGDDEDEEAEEEEEEEDSPPKPAKRAAASKKAGQAKKKKMEKDEDMEEDVSSEEEDSPVKKGKGAGRGRKKN